MVHICCCIFHITGISAKQLCVKYDPLQLAQQAAISVVTIPAD